MSLTRKSSPAKAVTLTGTDLPERLMEPLPKSVTERFPELAKWAEQTEQNYQALREVWRREQQQIATALNG